MKKAGTFLAILLVNGLIQAQTPDLPVLRIGSTFSPPLSQPDQKGMLDSMLKEAFRRIGYQVEFVIMPSERSLVEAEEGHTDGDNNRIAGLQARYPNLVQVPESNMTFDFVAFTDKPGLTLRSWEDLKPHRIAFIQGWKILEDNVTAPEVTKLATSDQLFRFLGVGRADIILYERFGGQFYLHELDLKHIRLVEPPLARREMFLYLNRKHAALVPALSKALREMKAEGTHARFFTK